MKYCNAQSTSLTGCWDINNYTLHGVPGRLWRCTPSGSAKWIVLEYSPLLPPPFRPLLLPPPPSSRPNCTGLWGNRGPEAPWARRAAAGCDRENSEIVQRRHGGMRHSECARDRIVLGEEAWWLARWDDAIEKTRRPHAGGMERHRSIQSVLGIVSCSGGEARWQARWG